MILIKKFKFSANLEYVNEYLEKKNILYSVDFENNTLFCSENDKEKVLKIIDDLDLDENDVEIDENFQNNYDEWHKNSLNPGYFTGGKIPFFLWDVKNYPFLIFTVLLVPVASYVIIALQENQFNFDIVFFFYLFLAFSMIYQWIEYKKKNRKN